MDHARAAGGFKFWDLHDWMPKLIAELSADLKVR